MRKEKEAFLRQVWERIKGTDCIAMDAVLEVAVKQNIEVEAAAKIIKGDAVLHKMIQEQAIHMNKFKPIRSPRGGGARGR